MANFEPKKLNLDDINGGIRFTESDGITPNAINDPIEAVAYSQTVVEHLTDTPDISEINGVGNPNVSFVSNTTADGVTIHKFKFSNLSGATFTPSLDEAGNLSWSNNRNLPNPPTINISGRDYLYSSYEGSGTYIPQPNDTISNIPISSFNREPVDDIDHCYLFYYYTPENIYYWLATQVVDIQETTATLKILSVVRLTGYTPTIGENGNWFIGGEDTGKLSYGASGVTDVVAGASYNQNDYTITPLTFNFEVGNSKTVNVKAAVGNVEDGSYAKLAQVVRVDTAQSLTDTEKTRAKDNLVIQTTKTYSPSTTIGWYRVAKLNRQSAYSVTIGQAYNYTKPMNLKLALNLGYQKTIITQESGIVEGNLLIDRVRVCIGTTTDAFFDVHISNATFSTTKISIDRLYNIDNAVAIETYADWEYLGTSDTVTGYTVTQLDMVSGTNTSGQVYQQGSPVLVGDQSAIFESDGTTVKKASKLATPRALPVNLALPSGNANKFDGSADTSLGVTGTLPVANGGTGATDLSNVTVGRATADGNGNNIPNTYATKALGTYTAAGLAKIASTTNGGIITSGTSDDTVPTVKNICDWVRNNFLTSDVPSFESGSNGGLTLPEYGIYILTAVNTSGYYFTAITYWNGASTFCACTSASATNAWCNITSAGKITFMGISNLAAISYAKL